MREATRPLLSESITARRPQGSRGKRKQLAPCGTYAAYQRHSRVQRKQRQSGGPVTEVIDPACQRALADYMLNYRDGKLAAKTPQHRALSILRQEHNEEYRMYLAEEMAS